MKKGVKFRIYPNCEQQKLINQTFGCCRLVYNKGLDIRKNAYKGGTKAGYTQTSAMLTELKKDRAYVNFFQKRARHPQFKSKHSSKQSYRTINQGENIRIVAIALDFRRWAM